MKLQDYTLRYFGGTTVVLIGIWAVLFYLFIFEFIYTSIDEDLKRVKLGIIRESYEDPRVLKVASYGAYRFKVTPLPRSNYMLGNTFEIVNIFLDHEDQFVPMRKLTCVFYDRHKDPYLLEIVTSIWDENKVIKILIAAFVLLYICIVLCIALLNRFFIKRVWSAFFVTLRQLRNYKISLTRDLEVPDTSVDEFNYFINEMKGMVERMQLSFRTQRSFIENLSHELQTPFAVLRSKLELLSENRDMTEEQLREIGNINETLNRMIRLNKSLLLLSKVDNMHYSEMQMVNFTTQTKFLLDDFSDLADYRGINIDVDYKGHFVVEMNPDLANILISNFLKNAINHNIARGEIKIEITDEYFLIKNLSEGQPLDDKRIFDRFYQKSNSEHSSGLGLSIVRSIIDTTPNLAVEYQFHDNWHIFKLFTE